MAMGDPVGSEVSGGKEVEISQKGCCVMALENVLLWG